MKLAKHQDAIFAAAQAHDALTAALDQLGMAILYARQAGALPAVKGITSAAERLRSLRFKLEDAVNVREKGKLIGE